MKISMDVDHVDYTNINTRECMSVEEMATCSEGVDRKQTYKKGKRKRKITWNRSKNNKLKSEVASIQSLKEAYNNVRLVISEPNL
jgi:hypothetical protein